MLKQPEILRFVQLIDIYLGGVEQHAAFESFAPEHLHLDEKPATRRVGTMHINNGVTNKGCQFGNNIGLHD